MKKALLMVLSLVLVVALTIGGTLAYLTDRDSKTNVFTVGDVRIELNEDFDQGATLVPGVNIEKKATVKNIGKNDAWVWVKIAIPSALDNDDASKNVIHFNFTKESVASGLWNWKDNAGAWMIAKDVEINGVKHNVYTVKYDTVLKPNEETSEPVMYKVYMDYHIDIDTNGDWYHVENGNVIDLDWNTNTNGAPVMYVSAYAIQAEGFNSADEAIAAYKSQWGDKGDEYAPIPTIAASAEDMQDALTTGGTIYLEKDVSSDAPVTIAQGADVDINLKDNTLTGTVVNNGDVTVSGGTIAADDRGFENYGTANLTDVTVNAGSAASYSDVAIGANAVTTYDNVNIVSEGGGVGAAAGAKVVFNSGSVAVNSPSTSGRYVFYTEGAGSEITINGGEFSFSKTLNQKRAYISAGAGTTVYVNGGTFGPASTRSGYTAGILGEGTVIIKGGTFGFNPSAWVASGYVATDNGNGTWTVSAQ